MKEKKFLLNRLRAIADAANVFDDEAEKLACSSWPSYVKNSRAQKLPLAVVRPGHESQILELIEFCGQEGLKLIIRGGGTGWPGPVARDNAIILSTSAFRRVLETEPESRSISVQCGATSADLERTIKSMGLFYPLLPSHPLSTIGGNIAQNHANFSSLKYGYAANYVEMLEGVDGTGHKLQLFSANGMPGKLAPDYSFAALFCGSLGELGIILKVKLKLLDAPTKTEYFIGVCQNFDRAAEIAANLGASKPLPACLGIINEEGANLASDSGIKGAAVYGSYAGWPDEVEAGMVCVKKNMDASVIKISDPDFWHKFAAKTAQLTQVAYGMGDPCRCEKAACPPSRFPAFVEALNAICNEHSVKYVAWGAPGAAFLNVILTGSSDKTRTAAKDLFDLERVTANAIKDERELGQNREEWNKARISNIALGLKKIMDPYQIFGCSG